MEPNPAKEADPVTAKTVAAVNVGANALRMVIAEVFSDGRIEVLEQLQRAVRLGQDTFRRGRLGGESMRAAIGVLRDYRQLLDLYKVEKIRAVATTAVREAANGDTFLDRVFMATRLNVEVIDTSEESRLTVSAVCQAVGDALGVNQRQTLIADVGGGSTLLTVLEDGEIATSQSLRLGSIRLQEMFSTSEESPRRSADLLAATHRQRDFHASSAVPLDQIDSFVAVGGDARFAAREIGTATESADLVLIEKAAFDKLVDRCERHTAEELSKRHGLPFAEAETLNPALLVYQLLLGKTKAEQMIVSHISMRDGLLLELAREVTGKEDEASAQGRDPFGHGDRREVSRRPKPRPERRGLGRSAVRRVSGRPRAGAAAAAVASRGGAVARGRRLREQPRPPQAQRIPNCQRGDFRAQPQRDHGGRRDCPLPSPQRAEGVASGVHGAGAGVAGGGEQAGGVASRGRRPDPRPSSPGRRHQFPATGRRVDRHHACRLRSPARRNAPLPPRATCWKTFTG